MPLSTDLQNDPQATVNQLIEDHGHCLYQMALRICGTHEDAEDLVQETFLLAFRHWSQFRGESSPKTWLYSIAARVCQRTKRLKVGQPKRLESFEELIPQRGDGVPDVWSLGGPLKDSLLLESKEHLSSAIADLPLDFRMPLVLKDIAELSVQEVALVLGIPTATVKTRVHRARLHLRRRLASTLPVRRNACVADRQICLDLVHAKLNTMDRGDSFSVPDDVICQRCESLFATLDLTQEVCLSIGQGALPEALCRRLVDSGTGAQETH